MSGTLKPVMHRSPEERGSLRYTQHRTGGRATPDAPSRPLSETG